MPAPLLDPGHAGDRHTAGRLQAEPVIWLGTASPEGRPHHVPVWFAWDDPLLLAFSMPGTRKWRHIQHSPAVSLSLDSAASGTDIVIAEGQAALPGQPTPELDGLTRLFQDKYLPQLGPDNFAPWRETFSEPVLITVERIIAWTRSGSTLAYRVVPESPSS
jgi:PPOX class probable F420-dependent enzyme